VEPNADGLMIQLQGHADLVNPYRFGPWSEVKIDQLIVVQNEWFFAHGIRKKYSSD